MKKNTAKGTITIAVGAIVIVGANWGRKMKKNEFN